MRLVAYMVAAPLECDRYLRLAVESLAEFCDEIRVWADGSPETVRAALRGTPADVEGTEEGRFWFHEGNVRQLAYEWALRSDPTYVLAIDADEFVADGRALRAALKEHEAVVEVAALCMQEIWAANPGSLTVRMDGGWNPHPIPIVWKPRPTWRIPNKAHASGRTPAEVLSRWDRSFCPAEILHFGWANKAERAARYQRYADTAGFGHNSRHVRSIMDASVSECHMGWPEGLREQAANILAVSNRMEVRT